MNENVHVWKRFEKLGEIETCEICVRNWTEQFTNRRYSLSLFAVIDIHDSLGENVESNLFSVVVIHIRNLV